MEYRTTTGSIRAAAEPLRQFEAQVISYGVVDSYGSVWRRGCFTKSLRGRLPRATIGHDWSQPIGHAISYTDGIAGLQLVVQLDDFQDVPLARQVYSQLKSGTLDSFSVGFERAEGGTQEPTPSEREAGAREAITEAQLHEISAVLSAAVPGTHLIGVRHAFEPGDPAAPMPALLEEALLAEALVAERLTRR